MGNNNIDDKWLIVYQGYLAQYKDDYAKDSYNDKLVLVTGDKKSASIDARKSYLCVANEENSIEIPIPDLWIEKIQIGDDTRSWTTRVLNLAKENGINISFGDDGKTVTIGIDEATLAKINSIDDKADSTDVDTLSDNVNSLSGVIGSKVDTKTFDSTVTGLQSSINSKADSTDVETLSQEVNQVKNNIQDTASRVENNTDSIANLNGRVDALNNSVSGIEIPTKLPNPKPLGIKIGNGTRVSYDGQSVVNIDIVAPTTVGKKGEVFKSHDGISVGWGNVSWDEIANKPDAVNLAKDLTGVLEATPEEFTFRPSAGDKSIRDESAVIRRIKGNTVVFAQLSKHTDTLQREDDWSVAPEVTTNTWGVFSTPVQVIANHKYLFYINKKDGRSIIDTYTLLKGAYRVDFDTTLFITSTETASWTWTARYQASTNGLRFQTQAFDLTNLFGAGNEPTTLEEFKGSYPDIYPYCDPEIRNMRAWGIETVSANAFNKDEVSDGALHVNGTISSYPDHSVATIEVVSGNRYSLHNIANIRYNYALYDSNYKLLSVGGIEGTITNLATTGDIDIPNDARYMRVVVHNDYLDSCCVNLRHSGTFGNDTTYFRKVRELPEIANYFPDGMNGIGEVYDEINAENAIQRCGVRAYEDGDENNPNVMTDRTNTVYQLDEPIVTPITEPLQLDYDVADFGTEKALTVPKSSPFRADIVYQFNAEGRIRDNGRNIDKLELQVNTLDEVTKSIASHFDGEIVRADGLVDGEGNHFWLPSTRRIDKDKRLASEQFVIDSLPREVAQVLERKVGTIPQHLSPNILYEFSGSVTNLTIVSFNGQDDNYEDVWRVRCGLYEGVPINILPTILWENGIAPNPTEWGIYEFEFRKTPSADNNRILGKFKVYK